ncbi:hypothetical protein P5V15_004322 [Pogonomyrmex californicus]
MRLYSSFNRGHHYILTVIDALSKYAWAISLKSKIGNEMANAIAKIIRESGRMRDAQETCKWIWERSFTMRMCRNS